LPQNGKITLHFAVRAFNDGEHDPDNDNDDKFRLAYTSSTEPVKIPEIFKFFNRSSAKYDNDARSPAS